MTDQAERPRPPRVVAVDRRDADLLPAYGEVLQRCGWELRAVGDVVSWAAGQASPVVLIKISGTGDWARLEQVARSTAGTVVSLLLKNTPSLYRRAFLSGASGVAAATDAPVHVARVLQAALQRYALLPVAALRDTGGGASRRLLSEDEVTLLQNLAAGLSTDELAEREGCSERTIYRRLRHACTSLQVQSRTEAVAVAKRLGLLDGSTLQGPHG